MSLISRERIDELINKADIVSIISKYIKVSKKGRNYWAVCPFHEDSNPSMSISPDKKIYKCFSCGASGNVITFVENYLKTDFIGAIKLISSEIGFDLSELNDYQQKSKYTVEQEKIFEINEHAMQFYKMVLQSQLGTNAIKYLNNRGITKNEIVKWDIGFASKEKQLFEHLSKQGYLEEEIEKTGLISIVNSKVNDYYFERIIFPIRNEDSKVIGFSARALEDIKPKYINSRENAIFKKSNLAYNINNINSYLNLKKSIIVLEGFMDVISLSRIGWENSIALMGTTLSDYHIKMFKHFNVPIKLFLDGDLPGIQASIKAVKKMMENNVQVSVINNDSKNDPDELIKQGLHAKVEMMIKNSVHPSIFVPEKLSLFYDINNPDELRKYLNEVFGFVLLSKDLIIIDSWIEQISKQVNNSFENIKKYYEQFLQKNNTSFNKTTNKVVKETSNQQNNLLKDSAYERAEKRVFLSLLKSNQYLEQIQDNLDYFENPDCKIIIQNVIEEYERKNYTGSDIVRLLELLNSRGIHYDDLIIPLVKNDLLNIELNQEELDDSFIVMKKYQLSKEIEYYDNKISNASSNMEKKSYLKLKEQLIKQKQILNKRGEKY